MFDLAIIGAGPGGYVAAIRAAQLGAKVALIEKDNLGGVCLNRGCIPTKALIASAHALNLVRRAGDFGVSVNSSKVFADMPRIQERKNNIVTQLRNGIAALIKSNGIELIKGTAVFAGPGKILVGGNPVDAKNILIATGSEWIEIDNLICDGKIICTSDEALSWTEIPKRLVIVGGGVIGCEFACMMRALGSEVTIVEATSSILPPVEKAISRLLARQMKGMGIKIHTDTKVQESKVVGDAVHATLLSGEVLAADRLLVAVGRRPVFAGLNLDAAGINLNDKNFIRVDEYLRTTAKNVYAIGDCIGGPMLAHAASNEGIAAVQNIFDEKKPYDSVVCPSPIFTTPEIGTVGLTSEELERMGAPFQTGRFPYAANGKAVCDGETGGQAVVLVSDTGNILGVHIFGKDATVLVAEAALAMKNGLTVDELAQTIHAHPTLSEVVWEAAEDAEGRAVHKIPARRETKS